MSQNRDGRVEGCVFSSSTRTLKLQLTAEQPLTGECWIPPKKKKKNTQCPRAKEKPQEDGRRGKIMLESNPIPTRDARRAQTKPCMHQDPRNGSWYYSPREVIFLASAFHLSPSKMPKSWVISVSNGWLFLWFTRRRAWSIGWSINMSKQVQR